MRFCQATLPERRFEYAPYSLGVEFQPAEAALLYAKVSRGYRAGGYNLRGANIVEFDVFGPEHVSPVVAYLAMADCPLTGRVFMAKGGDIRPFVPWQRAPFVAESKHITVQEVIELMKNVPDVPVSP